MKRPILGLLAAAILSLGLLGSSPVQAATRYSPTAATVTPAHHDGEDGHKYSAHNRQGGTRHHGHDDDDDDDGHRGRRRCSGLIVIFCS